MRRYIDFQAEDWRERADSRMQALRYEACMEGVGDEPPLAGVIDDYPGDMLLELLGEGFVAGFDVPGDDEALRIAAREAMAATLAEDLDTLGGSEYDLVMHMLAEEGIAYPETVEELEAAYTLRMRLWCDLGMQEGHACVCLDPLLLLLLPPLQRREMHKTIRRRLAQFDRRVERLLYVSGHIDDATPRAWFVQDVLSQEMTPEGNRLARNHLEATFDTYEERGRVRLVHEALADPWSAAGGNALDLSVDAAAYALSKQTGWHGLLPEEMRADEHLQRVLDGALRPEWATYEASRDLRLLAKQGAPYDVLKEALGQMLAVMPTAHMDSALREMRQTLPRWPRRAGGDEPPQSLGRLH